MSAAMLASRHHRAVAAAVAGLTSCAPAPKPIPTPPSAHTASAAPASLPPASSESLPPTRGAGSPYLFRNITILGGGFVTGVVFSSVKPGIVYARTDLGGAYRWDPANQRWLPLTDGFGRADSSLTGIESIAVDPLDAHKVYLAAGSYVQPWATNGALLRSNDQGVTWQRTNVPFRIGSAEPGRSLGERLAVDPNQSDILYFGSRKDGLWKSTDAAVTWSKVEGFATQSDPQGVGIAFVLFDAKSGTKAQPTPNVYVAVAGPTPGLFASTDAGEHFERLPGQPPELVPSRGAIDGDGILYVSYGNAPGPADITRGAVFRYDTRQRRFEDITPRAARGSDTFGYAGLALDARHPGTLMVTTIDRWARGDEIFRSNDGGRHWRALLPNAIRDAAGARYLYFHHPQLPRPGWMSDIDIDPFDPAHVVHTSGRGVWASDDVNASDLGKPTHWSFRNRGLENTVVTRVVSPPRGAFVLSAVGELCGFRHDDLERSPPQGMFGAPSCNTTTGLDFAGRAPETLVRVGDVWGAGKHGALSRDGGGTWTAFLSEPNGAETGGSVALSADGRTVLWAVRSAAVVVSRADGASWYASDGLPPALESPPWAPMNLGVAADRVNPSKFYVLDSAHGDAYVSIDRGRTFTKTAAGLPTLAEWARSSASIEAMSDVEGDVWLTSGKDVYRSVDSGRTWRALGTVQESHALGFGRGLPGAAPLSVFLVGKVAGVSGLFRSDDVGATWVRINDDRHQFGFIASISGDPKRAGRVYVGTGGRGLLYGDPR